MLTTPDQEMHQTQQQSEFDPASTDAEFDAAVANRPNQHASQNEWVQYTQSTLDILHFTNELYENNDEYDEYAQGIDDILKGIRAKYRLEREGETSPKRSVDDDGESSGELSGGEGGGGEGDNDEEENPEDPNNPDPGAEKSDEEDDEEDDETDDLDSIYLENSLTLAGINEMKRLVDRQLT